MPPDWLTIFRLDVGDAIEVYYDSIVLIKPKQIRVDENFLRKEFAILGANSETNQR
jgi:hypothetical protein